jgi:hypothetical protein
VLIHQPRLLSSSSHNRRSLDEQKPAQNRRNHEDRNQDPETHRNRSDSENDLATVICGCTPCCLDYSRFCRGMFQAVWILQRLLAHPPRPFPLGRGADQRQFALLPLRYDLMASSLQRSSRLVPRLRSSFSVSLTHEFYATGRGQLLLILLMSLTRPKRQNRRRCGSALDFLIMGSLG